MKKGSPYLLKSPALLAEVDGENIHLWTRDREHSLGYRAEPDIAIPAALSTNPSPAVSATTTYGYWI